MNALIRWCFLMCLLTISHAMVAQEVNILSDTIQWNSNSFTDIASSVSVEQPCYFITYRGEKVDWIQGGGSSIYSLTIDRTEGRWRDIYEDGTLTYKFRLEGANGKIIITRIGEVITLLFELRGLEDGDIINQYSINEIQVK